MKILVVGGGGREHALVWKLKQSPKTDKIYCAPGNGGISRMARCINIKPDNIKELANFAHRNRISLTVVGPEVPLAAGIVDEFQKRKLKIFGPTKEAAQIESSKVFSKEFMRRHHIPTAPFKVFDSAAEAIGFCKTLQFPAVVKADGLAAGKGVVVVKDIDQATSAINDMMTKKIYGKSGNKILIESFLSGQEVSVMAITDGKTIRAMLSSQDHKQALEGDRGPNTGGMGAYCPTEFTPPEVTTEIYDHILRPTVEGFIKDGITYKGIIYAGLMMTPNGPKVLEFNCRLGDPEAQVILPLLKTDLLEIMRACISQKLDSLGDFSWHNSAAACVIMASRGYPGKYKTGIKIDGLPGPQDKNCVIFHSGTNLTDNKWTTTGGRVLGVTGIDKNLKLALNRAYRQVNKIRFEGAMYRRDIGFRAGRPIK